MYNSILAGLASKYVLSWMNDTPIKRSGTRSTAAYPSDRFEAKDSDLVIAASSQKMWENLCEAIDEPELLNDSRFCSNEKRLSNADELRNILSGVISEKQTAEWMCIFERHGVPAAPIQNTLEIRDDEYLEQQEMINDVKRNDMNRSIPTVRYPVNFEGADQKSDSLPQELGESTQEYLRDLGYSRDEISSLKDKGVI
jgi:crotonobetainyl-CoA:carnitine CoA-transferase CaiB-like acyl-CoA transferase